MILMLRYKNNTLTPVMASSGYPHAMPLHITIIIELIIGRRTP